MEIVSSDSSSFDINQPIVSLVSSQMALQFGKRITLLVAEMALKFLLVSYRNNGFVDFEVSRVLLLTCRLFHIRDRREEDFHV